MFTELNERILWFDGDSTIEPQHLDDLIASKGAVEGIHVTEVTKDIEKFNRFVYPPTRKIGVKKQNKNYSNKWNIPNEYFDIDLKDYFVGKLHEHTELFSLTEDQVERRAHRIAFELKRFEETGNTNTLRALIYIINTLSFYKIVWGVGRGSSVSSYLLYLIGVHDVDSVHYELDLEEFLHT